MQTGGESELVGVKGCKGEQTDGKGTQSGRVCYAWPR